MSTQLISSEKQRTPTKSVFESLNNRGKVVALGLIATAATVVGYGAVKGGEAVAQRLSNHAEYTTVQLDNMPQQPYAIQAGDGADSAIEAVDPKTLSSDPQGTEDLQKFIEAQGALPNGQLEPGQTVEVPEVPKR